MEREISLQGIRIVYPEARRDEDMKAGRFEPLCAQSGEPLELLATDEESKLHPTSVYGITKQNQEQMVMVVCKSLGLAGTALRYQNVYGPGQSLSNPYTGILSIFRRASQRQSTQYFRGRPREPGLCFIEDVVDATVAALLRPEADGRFSASAQGGDERFERRADPDETLWRGCSRTGDGSVSIGRYPA